MGSTTSVFKPGEKHIGRRFGKLVIESVCEALPRHYGYEVKYLAICDCGNKKIVSRSVILAGKYMSCGCITREQRKKLMDKWFAERERKLSTQLDALEEKKKKLIEIKERFHAMAKRSSSLTEALKAAHEPKSASPSDPQGK